MASLTVTSVDIPGLEWRSGKVRDRTVIGSCDSCSGLMIVVTTDRISAFDAVLPTPIPRKGVVLNQVSNFWKRYLAGIIPNDIVSSDVSQCLPYLGLTEKSEWAERLKGRTVLVEQAMVVPVECVVRGYISGSCWQEYQQMREKYYGLPDDLKESDRLPQPIFTPSTKAESGHDESLTYDDMVNCLELWLLGQPAIKQWANPKLLAQALKSTSLLLYFQACDYAERKGVIIADTKFEFGFVNGKLTLIDEVLTPDSSRFWDAARYRPGGPQPSFDKQPVRDWLTASGWNKEPPAPALPKSVVRETRKRYLKVAKRFTDKQGDLP